MLSYSSADTLTPPGSTISGLADSSLYARYVYAYLTVAALNARHVHIGPNCTHPMTRNPAVNFSAMTTVDELSGARGIMNIGAGGGTELGLGQAKMKVICEMIEQGRALMTGEAVTYASDTLTLKGAKLRFLARHDMPVYMTASGPKMLELAGELCDGVIYCIAAAQADIARGAAKAARGAQSIDRACCVFGTIGRDRQAARDLCRSVVAWSVTTQPRYAALAGIPEEEVLAVSQTFAGSAHGPEAQRAAALVSDRMIDSFTLAGDPEHFIRGIGRIIDSGVRHIEFFPEGDDHLGMTQLFASEVMRHFR
jgi:5,10-methylenetetrahydromethanopterin reductase